MQTILLRLWIATCIASAFAWNRFESFQDRFDFKREDLLDEDQNLIAELRSLSSSHEKRSWQSDVDDQLVGTGNLNAGSIIGLDGTIWAVSTGFALTSAEAVAIIALFNNLANVFPSGVTVSGVKYFVTTTDERSISGKRGATGVFLVKTEHTIVIGTYNEQMQSGNAQTAVETLADFLYEGGY